MKSCCYTSSKNRNTITNKFRNLNDNIELNSIERSLLKEGEGVQDLIYKKELLQNGVEAFDGLGSEYYIDNDYNINKRKIAFLNKMMGDLR